MRTISSAPLHDIQRYDLKSSEVSSGTTIMAVSTGDAVILGADSRVSTGTYVANRVSDKIAQLSEHIYCCRSGSAADTQALTDMVKHYLAQLAYVLFIYKKEAVLIFHSHSNMLLLMLLSVSKQDARCVSKPQRT